MYVQILPEKDALAYEWDVFDVTKVWPQGKTPLQLVGKFTLNRNPVNYHAEVEQSAFAPTHVVPGIEPSADKMLQGRLFSYPDTHRYRLGPNYDQIPINCPYAARTANYLNDGPMNVTTNNGYQPVYEPNSDDSAPKADPSYAQSKFTVNGEAGRYEYAHKNDDFAQPGDFWRNVLDANAKQRLVNNIVGHMGPVNEEVKLRQLEIFKKVDADFASRIAKAQGLTVHASKL